MFKGLLCQSQCSAVDCVELEFKVFSLTHCDNSCFERYAFQVCPELGLHELDCCVSTFDLFNVLCVIEAEPGGEAATMEIRHDLSSRQHSALHYCRHHIEHSGLETGYCLIVFLFIFLLQFFYYRLFRNSSLFLNFSN